MKKGIIFSLSLSVVVAVFSIMAFASTPKTAVMTESVKKDSKVITVTDSENSNVTEKATEARFLNMLNRNFVYDSAFETVEDIVNNSVVALLDMRESEDDSFIDQAIVSGFVYDMYGVEVDYSSINTQFEQKEGYLYIIPRGYEIYEHEFTSVTENEDGTFTVKTNVEIASHGGTVVYDVCETLFVKNADSQFGFNIVYSNIGTPASVI